jgi:hypothetical protein
VPSKLRKYTVETVKEYAGADEWLPILHMNYDEVWLTNLHWGMNVDGRPSRGRPRKRWMDCVRYDMKIKEASMEMMSDRREWKKKLRCAAPHSGIRGLWWWWLTNVTNVTKSKTRYTPLCTFYFFLGAICYYAIRWL